MSDVQGFVHPKFEAVRGAFAAAFARGDDLGASFAATIDGEPVIDLWGGWAAGWLRLLWSTARWWHRCGNGRSGGIVDGDGVGPGDANACEQQHATDGDDGK